MRFETFERLQRVVVGWSDQHQRIRDEVYWRAVHQARCLQLIHLLRGCREKNVDGCALFNLLLERPRAAVIENDLRARHALLIHRAKLRKRVFQADRGRYGDRSGPLGLL
jgi:hypothetical protein